MRNTGIGIVAPLVCAVGLLLSGCKDKAPTPEGAAPAKSFDISEAAANTLETSGKRLKFATVMYDPATPNFITPCIYVGKNVRETALAKDRWVVEYNITYMSGGQQVNKTATTRVSQYANHVHERTEHEEEELPHGKRLVGLAMTIDVTGQIPDRGTTFTGTAALSKEKADKGGPRDLEGTASLSAQP